MVQTRKRPKARKLLRAAKGSAPMVAGVLMLTGCNPAETISDYEIPELLDGGVVTNDLSSPTDMRRDTETSDAHVDQDVMINDSQMPVEDISVPGVPVSDGGVGDAAVGAESTVSDDGVGDAAVGVESTVSDDGVGDAAVGVESTVSDAQPSSDGR